MGFWGKIVGAATGFALGGPPGMLFGAVLGHAADSAGIKFPLRTDPMLGPGRIAELFGRREELLAVNTVILSAKLARCDGPVTRAEIDAFKQHFRIAGESAAGIGKLFDQARDKPELFRPYADQLGRAFADARDRLEAILLGLFAIARADGPVNNAEQTYLRSVHTAFGLDQYAWDRASGAAPQHQPGEPDPYDVLGVSPRADDKELRDVWRKLMRENHPDSLAAQGKSAAFIARASDKVARINAAWDRIKRERGL